VSDAKRAASTVNLSSCPPVAVGAILLERVASRAQNFHRNNRKLNMTLMRLMALDGSNHSDFLKFWRESGVRLNPEIMRGWMRSYGAVSATLSHLEALRLQVHTSMPFLMRLEDDIEILDASFLQRLNCHLTLYLKPLSRPSTESENIGVHEEFRGFDAAHFHFGPGPVGVGADVYLTSIRGADSQLRRICKMGIYNGFDFMTNRQARSSQRGGIRVLHIGKATSIAIFKRQNPPTGKGSIVKGLKHFNLSALRDESANWPPERCMQWAGLLNN